MSEEDIKILPASLPNAISVASQTSCALSEAERRRQFYIGTLCTHLNDKRNGAIVIVMQRLHADDLVWRILDLELSLIHI